ncbi:hypothetical protein VTL71DRAFT_4386 [Oculimacula yallundae]|uniref:Uncharacterized protein n=1 Tax=Oculimacula yallundae TaxID=86028 RepID=A0ABR4C1W6_9HELO
MWYKYSYSSFQHFSPHTFHIFHSLVFQTPRVASLPSSKTSEPASSCNEEGPNTSITEATIPAQANPSSNSSPTKKRSVKKQ